MFKKKLNLILLVIIIATLLISAFVISNESKKSREELNSRVILSISILKNLGFNGFIHNFKNYILRNEDRFFEKAVVNFNKINDIIRVYKAKDLSPEEISMLDKVHKASNIYYQNLKIVKDLRVNKNLNDIIQIDNLVKIPDDINEDTVVSLNKILLILKNEMLESEKTARLSGLLFYLVVFSFVILLGILYFYEILKLEHSNESLRVANEELLQFSYRSSHDLKAPLTTIKGLAGFIEEDLTSGNYKEVKENALKIMTQSAKLENLVTEILNLAKMDIQSLKAEIVDLNELAKDIKESHQHLLNINHVDLQVHIVTTRPHATFKTYLYQILSNIIINGIKYFDPQKNERFVKLNIRDDSKNLLITIEDNGIGIPAENKEAVYEIFKKFHSDNALGSGLGMYIVKKSIKTLGANIDYESSSKGTKFEITIPTR